ncbi:MAG: CsgG/HfaB family protein [Kiritimatiellia bacterium]
MNKLVKLALLGATALMVSGTELYAAADADDDEEVEEAAPKKKAKKKAKKAKKAGPERMFVAIHKFDNKSDASGSKIETLQSRVQQCVVGTRKFEVVEREQLKTVMKEANLAAAGITDGDDAEAPEQGKIKAASYVIYGSVLSYGVDRAAGSADGVAAAQAKSKVEVQLKITDGETGKILVQKSAIGMGIDKAMATEGFKQQTSGGMRDAVDEAAHMIVDALRDHCYPAKIVKVGKKDVTINMTDEEVKEEDIFDVVECGEMLFDPDTGAALDDDGDEVGRVQISRVGPKMSKATPMGDLDLDDLDLDEHSYKLRRVSKATLKKEAKKAHQKRKAAFESRF